jgi:hypothetical protein
MSSAPQALEAFPQWSQTVNALHDHVTRTANASGVDMHPDQLACEVILAIQKQFPNWRQFLSAPLSTSPAPAAVASEGSENAPVPVAASPKIDHTLTTFDLIAQHLQELKPAPTLFVRAALTENVGMHAFLASQLRAHSVGVINSMVERLAKFESRARDYGCSTFVVNGTTILMLKYFDVGVSQLTNAIMAQWPNATDIAFHTNISVLSPSELNFTHVYRIYKAYLSGSIVIDRYPQLGEATAL